MFASRSRRRCDSCATIAPSLATREQSRETIVATLLDASSSAFVLRPCSSARSTIHLAARPGQRDFVRGDDVAAFSRAPGVAAVAARARTTTARAISPARPRSRFDASSRRVTCDAMDAKDLPARPGRTPHLGFEQRRSRRDV